MTDHIQEGFERATAFDFLGRLKKNPLFHPTQGRFCLVGKPKEISETLKFARDVHSGMGGYVFLDVSERDQKQALTLLKSGHLTAGIPFMDLGKDYRDLIPTEDAPWALCRDQLVLYKTRKNEFYPDLVMPIDPINQPAASLISSIIEYGVNGAVLKEPVFYDGAKPVRLIIMGRYLVETLIRAGTEFLPPKADYRRCLFESNLTL